MNVGDYVRTEYGISKIIGIFPEKTMIFIETDNGIGNCSSSQNGKLRKGIMILKEDYRNFIDNNIKERIIDLIEVGDYVNKKRVEWIGYERYEIKDDGKESKGIGYKLILFNEFTKDCINEKGIKSIVTKEQFESMEYKL